MLSTGNSKKTATADFTIQKSSDSAMLKSSNTKFN